MKYISFLEKIACIEHIKVINHNYKRLFGESLYDEHKTDIEMFHEVWNANFVLVSHCNNKDPIFNFGNSLALDLFEMEFVDFVKLPSRYSAEFKNTAERQKLLDNVTKNGFVKDYTGIRISSTGKRFYINNALIFNLYDFEYKYYGQSALINNWTYI